MRLWDEILADLAAPWTPEPGSKSWMFDEFSLRFGSCGGFNSENLGERTPLTVTNAPQIGPPIEVLTLRETCLLRS